MMKQTLKDFEKDIIAGVPLGRIGTPEDIAGTCLFLSSRAGEWITGYADVYMLKGNLAANLLEPFQCRASC
jgi:NAD(P)-dependent dehydrogenase (short-subunit alcohol dehydrogenase family)